MKEFWNQRYQQSDYAYGTEPNEYFREQLDRISPPGKLLLPAEGEGRNAVYAARQGWEVSAFDLSEAGQQKAEQLAQRHGVQIDYQVAEFSELHFAPASFDAIGLVFAHFPADKKAAYFQQLVPYLRPGGRMIVEVFSKNNLRYRAQNPRIGGPPDLETLFSVEEIQQIFPSLTVVELAEVEVELREGLYHIGTGSVIRFVGIR